MMTLFMFTTGIENSYPTIGQRRVDEMEKCKHYERWREDFALVEDLGIRFLRYGPPLHKTFLGPDRYDWEFADLDLRPTEETATSRRSSTCATSACRTGSAISRTPTSRSCSPTTPSAFAQRFPWVQLYTPSQRDVHLRHVLGRLRLVERADDYATGPS